MIPKQLFSVLPSLQLIFNPAYEPKQSIYNDFKYGSKKSFTTEYHINGEFFRSRTDNEYFWVVKKNSTIDQITRIPSFVPSYKLPERFKYLNQNECVFVRLEFTKNKRYFVESNQDITVENPDVTILDLSVEEILENTPKFIPIKQQE